MGSEFSGAHCLSPVPVGHTRVMSDDPRVQSRLSDHTVAVNAAHAASLQLEDDWERATRGLIAQHETGAIDGPLGLSWNTAEFDFLREQETAPPTVHPSLWRQARLNAQNGLFEVAENVWQARGYDISNITFIKGTEGWVIIDPLTTSFTARACLDLAKRDVGRASGDRGDLHPQSCRPLRRHPWRDNRRRCRSGPGAGVGPRGLHAGGGC